MVTNKPTRGKNTERKRKKSAFEKKKKKPAVKDRKVGPHRNDHRGISFVGGAKTSRARRGHGWGGVGRKNRGVSGKPIFG